MERWRDERMDKWWEGWRDRRMSGGMKMSLRMHEVSGESLWFPVLPTGGAHTPHIRKRASLPDGHRGDGVAVLGWGRELRRRAGRHLHGEIGDEGFLGQLHLEGGLLHSVSSVDYTAGDNRVSKSGRDLGVHSEAVDVDIILDQ